MDIVRPLFVRADQVRPRRYRIVLMLAVLAVLLLRIDYVPTEVENQGELELAVGGVLRDYAEWPYVPQLHRHDNCLRVDLNGTGSLEQLRSRSQQLIDTLSVLIPAYLPLCEPEKTFELVFENGGTLLGSVMITDSCLFVRQ